MVCAAEVSLLVTFGPIGKLFVGSGLVVVGGVVVVVVVVFFRFLRLSLDKVFRRGGILSQIPCSTGYLNAALASAEVITCTASNKSSRASVLVRDKILKEIRRPIN